MPTGQELTKSAMAVATSRPANQSTSIFVITTFRTTPPIPASTRPAVTQAQSGPKAASAAPQTISAIASPTTRFSPNRAAIAPPGSATTTPGAR
jgi:hypothetical protein